MTSAKALSGLPFRCASYRPGALRRVALLLQLHRPARQRFSPGSSFAVSQRVAMDEKAVYWPEPN